MARAKGVDGSAGEGYEVRKAMSFLRSLAF